MGIFERRDRASGLRSLAWRPGRKNWQAGSLLRRNGVAGYGNCLHVISVRARPQAPARTAHGALGIAQARTRVLAASRFHYAARRLAGVCVFTSAALTNRSSQRPYCDIRSICLPRHPAVAYLCLVRCSRHETASLALHLATLYGVSAPSIKRSTTFFLPASRLNILVVSKRRLHAFALCFDDQSRLRNFSMDSEYSQSDCP